MGVQALVLGLLDRDRAWSSVWEIGVLAALLGLNNAFENPARQSFMLEMVGPEHLRNAVSLNSVLVNVARAIGPGGRRHPDRDRRRRRLLPRQRGELRRGRHLAADARPRRADAEPAGAARPGPAARGPALHPPHARARGPAADDGARRLARLRVPGLAAGDGPLGAARRRDRLRLHDRGDGRRGGHRRAVRRRQRAHRAALPDRRGGRLRDHAAVRRRWRPRSPSSWSRWRWSGRAASPSCRPATPRCSSPPSPRCAAA